MPHVNARFMPAERLLIVRRIETRMPEAHVAHQMGTVAGHGGEVATTLVCRGRGWAG